MWAQVAVILLAFGLFCAGLTSESLWLDEVSSIYNSQLPLAQVVQEAAADTHPPLYYLVLHFTIRILSGNQPLQGHTGEFIARWPSVLAGVLSVAALMILGQRSEVRDQRSEIRDRVRGRRMISNLRSPVSGLPLSSLPLLAGLPFALSAYARWYAQETRMYALLTLWGVLATYWLLRAASQERAWRGWLVYIFICVAGLYTHYYFVMVLLVHNLLFLVELGQRWRRSRPSFRSAALIWIGVQGAIALAFAPWLPTLLTQVGRGEGLWIALAVGRPDPATLAYALVQMTGMPVSGPALLRYGAYALALGLCGWGAWQIRRPAWRAPVTVALMYALAPVLAALLISQARPIFASRYLLLALPGWCLLLALGVTALTAVRWRLVISGVLLLLMGLTVATQAATPENPPWREVAAWVRTQAQPGDFAVLIPSFHWRPFTYYAGRDLVAFEDELWLPNDDLDWRAQFAYAAQGHHRIWLIWWRPHWGDREGRVRAMLEGQGTLLSEREFPGVDLVLLYDLTGANLHP
ncbi:MAG: hypothetical protein IPO15_19800 [Anaerolineae bacterium]|uniref:glycosyltransferase family 39 protein n=1 Tax=Candidatus Amarolinea dominans TaxID=3140696 RepID=UPI00313707BF|nr:hypothetical protein [Anaerolineae bacterium]